MCSGSNGCRPWCVRPPTWSYGRQSLSREMQRLLMQRAKDRPDADAMGRVVDVLDPGHRSRHAYHAEVLWKGEAWLANLEASTDQAIQHGASFCCCAIDCPSPTCPHPHPARRRTNPEES